MKIAQFLNVCLQIIVLLLHFLYLSNHLRGLLSIKIVLRHIFSPITPMLLLLLFFLILLEAYGPLLIFNALDISQSVCLVLLVSDAKFAGTVRLLREFGFGGCWRDESGSVVAPGAECVTFCSGCRIDDYLLQTVTRYA